MKNENLGNNKPNLKDKIKNSQIYQRLIYRPFKMGTARSAISVMLYGVLFLIFFTIISEMTDIKPKPENELYRTDGVVIQNYFGDDFGFKGGSRDVIWILTDSNKTMEFDYSRIEYKLANKNLVGKRITIYSDRLPTIFDKAFIGKAVDEYGNVLKEYNYEWQKSTRDYILSFKPMLIVLFLLTLIYLINGKNTKKFDVENYWNNQNLKSQTKE